jgi:peptide/nickel transport system permease protein
MASLRSLLLRRLATSVPVLIGISIYVFLILQLSPIDPRYAALGIYASPQQRAQFARTYHLDQPIWVRYPEYLNDVVHGNLGINVQGQPVATLIHQALPVTVSLALSGAILSLLLAYALGISAGYFVHSWWDNLTRVVAFGGLSVAQFWLGLLLIEIFALRLKALPVGGFVSPSVSIGEWLQSLILPALTLATPMGCYLSRIVRNSVINELGEDYVRMARGCGLSERMVLFRHVLRNASVAPFTVAGIQIGYLLSGAVLVEVVFNMHGVGFLLWTAAQQGDSGVVIGVALVSAVVFVGVNLLVDIGQFLLNPRVRNG